MKRENIDQIDVEELISEFKVLSIDNFQKYLRELWKDLVQRSDDKLKGINKITFSNYYILPGILSDRLFAVFDRNNDSYLDVKEFTDGMMCLFSDSIQERERLIFNLYDFDNDNKITKEDCRVVISYIPLTIKENYGKNKLKYENEEYKDRIESQDELDNFLDKCFQGHSYLDYSAFLNCIEKICSDIYIFTLIFLLKKKPFSNAALENFTKAAKKTSGSPTSINSPVIKKLIASPNMTSKFSPALVISKSPTIQKRQNPLFPDEMNANSKNLLTKLAGNKVDSKNALMKFAANKKASEGKDQKQENEEGEKGPVRKARNHLKNIEDGPSKNLQVKKEYDDLPITAAKKQDIGGNEESKNKHDSDDEEDIRHEGFLCKITNTKKLKKLWFKLIGREMYYYKNKDDEVHKGMHNLAGVFVQEEAQTKIEGTNYFCFSILYAKKSRFYYVTNEDEYKNWVKYVRKAIGYSSLASLYDIKEKLGNGKFGLVRLGIHKETGRKVAVKIMSKKDMNVTDQQLVRTEIEILKICQHPHIIRLYDIFENADYIYLMMEYCSGGDLFSYIEKRGFRLPEQRAAHIIHKLSAAVYYLHLYGIAHRDLKPENILMTDQTENADIRLLDFGLSKIIGPNETCNEPYGTLSYVAPEILTEKPYTKAVDLWSIGIITYLLLVGYLPFDDEKSEREIARQTIHEPVSYRSSVWKKNSPESKMFVDNLLNKDPNKRMNIKEVLEHPWIKKFTNTDRRQSKEPSTFKVYTSTDLSNQDEKK